MKQQADITINGAQGEGGGQILRTSLSLAAVTGQPVVIEQIRAGRSRPGLQPQHLAAVKAAAAICAAQLEGVEIGSQRLRFAPQSPTVPGTYHFAIGTAGAAPLVMQTVLLPLALTGEASRVTVTGGTHALHAPTTDYLEQVYLPILKRQGVNVAFTSPRAGFFPKGGGIIEAEIGAGAVLQPISLTKRGMLQSVTALVTTAGLPDSVAQRGADTVRQEMRGFPGALHVEIRQAASHSPGAAIEIVAQCEQGLAGFSALGERGKRIETVAAEVCLAFGEWYKTGAACEEHLADQLALPAALALGESQWTASHVTEHLRTVLWVVPQFLPVTVSLTESSGGAGIKLERFG